MKTEKYTDNNGNEIIADSLSPCPFCEGEPDLLFIGNNYTKKRSVEIKCTKCFTTQIVGAIRNNAEWCAKTAIEQWNKRTSQVTDEQIEKKSWPDKIRLKMIEKSELYKPDERIYQYGYYDGFHVGRKETIQSCLTILGEHIKGGHNNKSLIGKILKSFKYNTTERTIINTYNELRETIKNI